MKTALAIRARRAAAQRTRREARIAAHLKARFPETYGLIAERVDAGIAEHIAALEDEHRTPPAAPS
jgi:hypothetical protein